MQSKSTKKALLLSLLSLVVCLSMLVGTTFAWFTDSVTSTGNRIAAGNLKVDFLMDKAGDGNYVSIADGSGDIFSEGSTANNSTATLWEPGKTQIVYLAVENSGSLDLKYNVVLNITNGGLIGSLEYAVIDGITSETTYSSWTDVKAATEQVGDVEAGVMLAAPGGAIKANETQDARDYFALAVHMKESAGNEYQGKNIIIDVMVQATQLASEEDSFGSDYDVNAPKTYTVNGVAYDSAEAALAAAKDGDKVYLSVVSAPITVDKAIELTIASTNIVAEEGVNAITVAADATISVDGFNVLIGGTGASVSMLKKARPSPSPEKATL